jgi:hypothetical protein
MTTLLQIKGGHEDTDELLELMENDNRKITKYTPKQIL